MSEFVPLDHPRFVRVERSIFIRRITPDCMTHSCRVVHDDNRLKLDACCQYGVDVDLGERDRILEHADQIRSILRTEAADRAWFHKKTHDDADFPSGQFVRTTRLDDGCIFLAHDGRGCAIHRASVEGGWDFDGVKPHVCRLFPLSYDDESICMSDDYQDYSCAYDESAPTVYRVQRETLAAVFGPTLVLSMDDAEARVIDGGKGRRSLPLAPIRRTV